MRVTMKDVYEIVAALKEQNEQLRDEVLRLKAEKDNEENRDQLKKIFKETAEPQIIEPTVTVKDKDEALEYTIAFTVKKTYSVTARKKKKLIAGIKPKNSKNGLIGIESFGLYLND